MARVIRSYLLAQVKNTVFGSVGSQYDYVNDALGRRTEIARCPHGNRECNRAGRGMRAAALDMSYVDCRAETVVETEMSKRGNWD